MNESPYTPTTVPTQGLEKSTLTMPVQKPVKILLDGDLVAQGIHTQTCPQCGLNPVDKLHKQKFQFIPQWVYLGLLANILVMLVLYYVGRKVIDTQLGLCDACAAQMKRARTFRALSIAGAIFGPMLLGGAAAAIIGSTAGLVVGATALVAGIVGSVVTHKRTVNDMLLVQKIEVHKFKGPGGQITKTQTLELKANTQFRATLQKEAPHLFKGEGPGRIL